MIFSDKKWHMSAVLNTAPENVYDQLVVLKQAEVKSYGKGYEDSMKTDPQSKTITLRGHWWYEGTYKITEQDGGSVVTYKVKNVAGFGTRTAAYLLNHDNRNVMTESFNKDLKSVCRELSCAYTIDR